MTRVLMILLALLTLGACREDNPYWDSSNWDMEATAGRMADLLEEQNRILAQDGKGNQSLDRMHEELWALLLDEYDTGFEIWVRLRRNPKLVPECCETLSRHLGPVMLERAGILGKLENSSVDLLRNSAPSDQAWLEFQPRLAQFGAAALLDRCGHRKGYRQRAWP